MKQFIVGTIELSKFLLSTKSAFSAGQKAYRMYVPRGNNPYSGKHISHWADLQEAWTRGWDKAVAEDVKRSPVGLAAQKLQRKFARAGAA